MYEHLDGEVDPEALGQVTENEDMQDTVHKRPQKQKGTNQHKHCTTWCTRYKHAILYNNSGTMIWVHCAILYSRRSGLCIYSSMCLIVVWFVHVWLVSDCFELIWFWIFCFIFFLFPYCFVFLFYFGIFVVCRLYYKVNNQNHGMQLQIWIISFQR